VTTIEASQSVSQSVSRQTEKKNHCNYKRRMTELLASVLSMLQEAILEKVGRLLNVAKKKGKGRSNDVSKCCQKVS